MIVDTKFIIGKYKRPVRLEYTNERIYFHFGYNLELMNEVKAMQGAKYHGYDEVNPRKVWSVKRTARNIFQIEFLEGKNPYARYDVPLISASSGRPLYAHQLEMKAQCLSRRHCILAAEMGTGKTLVYIEVMEDSGSKDWWFVAPKSALKSVELDLLKWRSKVWPKLITYDRLRSMIEDWRAGDPAPYGVIYDEASRVKTPSAKRSEAAFHLAEAIRKERGQDSFIVLGSGSPAPKSPADWWHLCEVACPGFIREGDIHKFTKRLGLIVEKESVTGGIYPHLVTWRDNPLKCNKCGELRESLIHDVCEVGYHDFEPSIDEVSKLYERMKGLVLVTFKKDCLDLPDLQYRLVECKPNKSVLRSASVIAESARNTITALTLLRELSDGFQYKDTVVGQEVCPLCNGIRTVEINEQTESCPNCNGTGEVVKYERSTLSIACPKEDALVDLLDEYSEVGRLVIYGGFTGSVDRCVATCKKEGWHVIRVDGRGWDAGSASVDECLRAMDMSYYKESLEKFPKLAFVGQPGAGGMGLTLTASPAIVYYSNDFNAESRIQSEARIHRIGMDVNRGATIIDLVHLPTDSYILENLKKKRDLQSKTLGELKDVINRAEREVPVDDTTTTKSN